MPAENRIHLPCPDGVEPRRENSNGGSHSARNRKSPTGNWRVRWILLLVVQLCSAGLQGLLSLLVGKFHRTTPPGTGFKAKDIPGQYVGTMYSRVRGLELNENSLTDK